MFYFCYTLLSHIFPKQAARPTSRALGERAARLTLITPIFIKTNRPKSYFQLEISIYIFFIGFIDLLHVNLDI